MSLLEVPDGVIVASIACRYRVSVEEAIRMFRLVVKPGMKQQDRPQTLNQLNEFLDDLEMADEEEYGVVDISQTQPQGGLEDVETKRM